VVDDKSVSFSKESGIMTIEQLERLKEFYLAIQKIVFGEHPKDCENGSKERSIINQPIRK